MKTLTINITNSINETEIIHSEIRIPVSSKVYGEKEKELKKIIQDSFINEILFTFKSKEEAKEIIDKKVADFFKKDIRAEKLRTIQNERKT
jgi:hypothetical protein